MGAIAAIALAVLLAAVSPNQACQVAKGSFSNYEHLVDVIRASSKHASVPKDVGACRELAREAGGFAKLAGEALRAGWITRAVAGIAFAKYTEQVGFCACEDAFGVPHEPPSASPPRAPKTPPPPPTDPERKKPSLRCIVLPKTCK